MVQRTEVGTRPARRRALEATQRVLLQSTGPGVVALFALLSYAGVYRVRLYHTMKAYAEQGVPIVNFLPPKWSTVHLAAAAASDLAGVVLTGVLCGAVAGLVHDAVSRRWPRSAQAVAHAAALAVVLGAAFVFGLNYRLLVDLHTPLTKEILLYASHDFTVRNYLPFVHLFDVIFVGLMMPIYLLHVVLPLRARAWVRSGLLCGGVIMILSLIVAQIDPLRYPRFTKTLGLWAPSGQFPLHALPESLAVNPLSQLARQAFARPARPFAALERPVTDLQRRTVGFVDPAFTHPRDFAPPPPARERRPWNVLILQLESVTPQSVFGDADGVSNMPFIRRLASSSLVLANHYTTASLTDQSVFTMYTGLYPMVRPLHFVARKDLRLPTLFSLLGPGYTSVMVTSSDSRAFFPRSLLLNSGLQSLADVVALPVRSRELFWGRVADEAEIARSFIERLRSLAEPFVAVYYPYSTHWPYLDGGAGEAGDGRRPAYRRALRFVDRLVEGVVGSIQSSGLAERTIIVIVSDHGEAFGEHAGSFGHGATIFNEAVRVPALLYQPRLFPARVMHDLTSHVDIVPTLLDAMGRSYDPRQFQGESVLRDRSRRYVFMYAPATDLLGSVSPDGIKLIADFPKERCTAYDVRLDPRERDARSCESDREQLSDLVVFRRFQTEILLAYQQACASIDEREPLRGPPVSGGAKAARDSATCP